MEMYCPQCRAVCGTTACPTDDRGRCIHCGKPPVAAIERNKSWLWCSQHDQWHDRVCPDDVSQHCCKAPAA